MTQEQAIAEAEELIFEYSIIGLLNLEDSIKCALLEVQSNIDLLRKLNVAQTNCILDAKKVKTDLTLIYTMGLVLGEELNNLKQVKEQIEKLLTNKNKIK